MDLAFTPKGQAIREVVRAWVTSHPPTDIAHNQEHLGDALRIDVDKGYTFDRRRAAEKAGGSHAAPFAKMAELGLTGLYMPEDDGVMGLFLVERESAGVSPRGYNTQVGGRAAEVAFKNAPATLITTQGQAALEHAVDIDFAANCAEAVGVMDKMQDITAEYMNPRKQFGVAISSLQALRHRIADMTMQLNCPAPCVFCQTQAQCPSTRTPRSHSRRQIPAGHQHAPDRPAGSAMARRHWCNGRVNRGPLLPQTHRIGNEIRRYPSPPG